MSFFFSLKKRKEKKRKENIPSIRILRLILTTTIPRNINAIEQHIRTIGNKLIPLRRIPQLQRADRTPVQSDNADENGPQDERILCIQVVPDLAVTVEFTTAVDVDVCAAEVEEGGCVLEGVFEGVLLPVICVWGEGDFAEDFWVVWLVFLVVLVYV